MAAEALPGMSVLMYEHESWTRRRLRCGSTLAVMFDPPMSFVPPGMEIMECTGTKPLFSMLVCPSLAVSCGRAVDATLPRLWMPLLLDLYGLAGMDTDDVGRNAPVPPPPMAKSNSANDRVDDAPVGDGPAATALLLVALLLLDAPPPPVVAPMLMIPSKRCPHAALPAIGDRPATPCVLPPLLQPPSLILLVVVVLLVMAAAADTADADADGGLGDPGLREYDV